MLSSKKCLAFGMVPYSITDCLKNYKYLDLSSYKSHNIKWQTHWPTDGDLRHKNCIKFVEYKQLKLLANTTSTFTVYAAGAFVMLISLADTALFCEAVWRFNID
jgi:hypothetical protein